MLKTFDCPKCGAPVSYEKDVVGASLTARCPYCNSSLAVPDEMLGRPARIISHVNIDLRNTVSGGKATKWILVIVLIPLFGVLIGAIAMGGFLLPLLKGAISPGDSKVTPPTKTGPTGPGDKGTGNAFATQILNFGSEGIGPGMFKDARSIAVDGAGRIYVGEYSGGRIQVFDPEGKFITQWSIGDRKTILRGLAADRKGTVYAVHGGNIYRYQAGSGELLGQLEYEGKSGFDDVTAAADGGLVAAWYSNRDDIVRFDSSGKAVRTIPAAISGTSGDSELSTRVAVDGSGNIYALGRFNSAVFKFTPEGKFVNRFGGPGDQAGQFRAAYSVAVDGKGRVYVGDTKGIQVFDDNGRYLTVFSPNVLAFGMVFNDKNELFVAARNHVVKLALKEP
jgi:sugar lactone lactonase YvrE/DNA-directed RNA polymerase subunit RPC12/RpoP